MSTTSRIDIIGTNGNDGLVYIWQDLERIGVRPSIELCEQVAGWNCGWREHMRRCNTKPE